MTKHNRGQRINLVGGLPGQEYSFESLYMKNLMSVTPLNCVLKAFIFALNDSAEALVSLCVSFLHICSDGFQDANDDGHQQEWKDVVFSQFAVHVGADEVSQ